MILDMIVVLEVGVIIMTNFSERIRILDIIMLLGHVVSLFGDITEATNGYVQSCNHARCCQHASTIKANSYLVVRLNRLRGVTLRLELDSFKVWSLRAFLF